MLWLLRSRLPLDDMLATYRFHLPSKCSCYSIPQSESILYLFMEGVIVTDVWRFFGSLCEMVFTRGHFQVCLDSWWLKRAKSESLKFVFHLLPILICWHI